MNKYDGLREKCAVVGVSSTEGGSDAAHLSYQALFALQHRGVEASGIAVSDSEFNSKSVRKPGMVRDVFTSHDIAELQGEVAVGHNRYSTSGSKHDHMQPTTNKSLGYALAHNGNLPITEDAEKYLNNRHYVTRRLNDSEIFAHTVGTITQETGDPVEAIKRASDMVSGAYSCTVQYGNTLIAFRDSYGIRPLELGKLPNAIMAASETCALDTVGASHIRSVNPGELVVVQNGKIISSEQYKEATPKLDIFELVYFARHDSYLYNERVYEVRRRFGEELAAMHPPAHDSNVVVVPVPDTSLPVANGYATALGLPREDAIVKNRYVGRTFMQPNQASRKESLQLKHTIISERIENKHVYMIDDSIVRGNTLPRLVKAMRELGALSVNVLISSPPIRFPDYYGVDTPDQENLIAANLTPEQIRQEITADYLGFLSVSAMVRATHHEAHEFNLASFTGEYPIDIGKNASSIKPPVDTSYLD